MNVKMKKLHKNQTPDAVISKKDDCLTSTDFLISTKNHIRYVYKGKQVNLIQLPNGKDTIETQVPILTVTIHTTYCVKDALHAIHVLDAMDSTHDLPWANLCRELLNSFAR